MNTDVFALKSRRVLLPNGMREACILIEGERIAAVDAPLAPGVLVQDLGDLIIMPGLVDTHAHINEPGRTEWEGFTTATRAAAAGGITTVIDMPLNSIPATTTLAALEIKSEEALGKCSIDYGFWGGVVPGNLHELEPMVLAGALGFKAFLVESGVDEFKYVGRTELLPAMKVLAQCDVPLLVHAELEGMLPLESTSPRDYRTYLESRPKEWENQAVRLMIELAAVTGCRTHIVHLSSAEAIQDLVQAKQKGIKITAETCPHYLSLAAEEVGQGATEFKCAPPIRERENREMLWAGLKDKAIDFIVSDHSPCTPSLKLRQKGDFMQAWGGISSIQFSLTVIWTEMRARGIPITQLSKWMSEATAQFAGISAHKGALAVGKDADLVVFDDDASFTLTSDMILHRHPVSPYLGKNLQGAVICTYLRGKKIYEQGDFLSGPRGKWIKHEARSSR